MFPRHISIETEEVDTGARGKIKSFIRSDVAIKTKLFSFFYRITAIPCAVSMTLWHDILLIVVSKRFPERRYDKNKKRGAIAGNLTRRQLAT